MPTSQHLPYCTRWSLLLSVGLTLFGCLPDGSIDDDDDSALGDDDDSSVSEPLDIQGTWTDNWDTVHTISSTTWSDSWGAVFNISQYDNAARIVIAQNDADNDYNALQWSRFDWYVEMGTDLLWYCQTCYDCADEAAALTTPSADTSDPANSGCGAGGWSSLTATASP